MALLQNKKVRLSYEILKTFEAGMVLFGFEVKSLRTKHGILEGAYIIVRGNEVFLVGMTIPPYQASNTPETYDPNRVRKLLLNMKEIQELGIAESEKGLTIVPISVYNSRGKIKIEIAIARGRKKYDKRQVLKKRDDERDMRRTLKTQY